jgi:glyoxalase-like protein
MSLLLHLIVLSSLLQARAPCVASPDAPALDHVVLVVRNLDSAAAAFRAQGFRIKSGRLHPNNLLNRHIKFRDGSSLELMSLAGPPGDDMARDYAELLTRGDAGVYVALSVPDLGTPQRAAPASGLRFRRSASSLWQFLSFPGLSPAAGTFFVAGSTAVQDPDSLILHQPDVDGLREVWVEGGAALNGLLERLGAGRCGPARSANGLPGERWALRRGFLVVVPVGEGIRPRVLGVALQSRTMLPRSTAPLPAFWIEHVATSQDTSLTSADSAHVVVETLRLALDSTRASSTAQTVWLRDDGPGESSYSLELNTTLRSALLEAYPRVRIVPRSEKLFLCTDDRVLTLPGDSCPIKDNGIIVTLSTWRLAGDSLMTGATVTRTAGSTWAESVGLLFRRLNGAWQFVRVTERWMT